MQQHYNDFGVWLRQLFPFRIQKISVDAGFSCPNRDGRISRNGCTFCDNRTFNPPYCNSNKSIGEQLKEGKSFFARKYPNMKYLAYFQAYSNTYAPVHILRQLYEEALAEDDIIGIVIGTRPDCFSTEIIDYLEELNKKTFLIVELGIESTNNDTLQKVNRGHTFDDSLNAVKALHNCGILVCAHIILGLPGEGETEILHQAKQIATLPINILKLHQLQIIKGTAMSRQYTESPFHLFTVNEYIRLLGKYLPLLRKDIILERFLSQSPADMLIAPRWQLKNHEFVHLLNTYLEKNHIFQGSNVL